MGTFVAIDFETADDGRESACAVGLVTVRAGKVLGQSYRLIRPPPRDFVFTYLHGIAWADVRSKPDFAGIWPTIARQIEGADYLLVHNAPFDRSVLEACCAAHSILLPAIPFVCTVKLARALWNVRPTRLPDVCRYLKIDVRRHHHAAWDALACAQIGVAALSQGRDLDDGLVA